jgi:hypothetical protein
MKGSFLKKSTVLLATVLLLNSCATEDNTQTKTPPPSETTSTVNVEALEKQLTAQLAKESHYLAEIAALQEQLDALSSPQTKPDALAENLTFYYRAEAEGAVITGYSGNAALLRVPEVLDGLPVVAIGEHAFEKAGFTAVILPECVSSIGWFAFYECPRLVSVTIPASVTSIGYAVFDGCGALTLHCPAGSYAEGYARSYGIPCRND